MEERGGFGEGRLPISTHGGCQSHSHNMCPYNHSVIGVVRQFRNDVPDRCPGWSEGVHTYDRTICRKVRDPKVGVACGPITGIFSFALLVRD